MIVRRRSAGDIIEARCTRCRDVLNHTIVAMVEERVVRVQCNTCGGQHNYHPPQEEKKSSRPAAAGKTASPRTRKEAAPAAPVIWEGRMAELDPDKAIPYRMDATLRNGTLVSHSTFGLGVVTAVIKPNKAEILFREGTKLLRCTL
ncbi:hypothetical protein [Geobacter pickeringii]|uniref:Uncharacterized protein n=1 Tax=Geobacter pickeringii TaxID=345632 RepID=A0A0B5BAM1_9BACT|nr:hypothetical protein [Geobacter pickeringii]AJE02004.1 hypothetical protein GPICK_00215 [Geobacter pickeringii]